MTRLYKSDLPVQILDLTPYARRRIPGDVIQGTWPVLSPLSHSDYSETGSWVQKIQPDARCNQKMTASIRNVGHKIGFSGKGVVGYLGSRS